MQPATLGGVRGSAEVWRRDQPGKPPEWRGTFAFREADEDAMLALENARAPVTYEGVCGGERGRIDVRVSSVLRGLGLAFFEGSGDLRSSIAPGM
jgi:hypothetical protein